MPSLYQQRCFNHADREAAARCKECGRYFCRECVTEHAERLLCAACLAKVAHPRLTQRGLFVLAMRAAQCLAGILVAWLFFHLTAVVLMKIPTDFHEGTLWQKAWWEKE